MIRRVRADQWERLRDLRLAALRDSPIAYLETEQAALARPEEDWRDWAARGAAGDRLALRRRAGRRAAGPACAVCSSTTTRASPRSRRR